MKLFSRKRRDNQGRSNEHPIPSPSLAAPSTAPSSSCPPESRTASGEPLTPSLLPSTSDSSGSATAATREEDFISSEEEFQVQLALAISNSEFPEDPHGDQIRAAKLLSLRKETIDPVREEGTADALSRRYWEYNVLDYEEKVVDGFYDIFGPSKDSSIQVRMPALVDLQNGNLGFEAIVINHETDAALVELEQVAQCIVLDCPVVQLELLVQRLAELVAEHMGGPVKDASIMLARWSEKSLELRTNLQTSLLPIGGIRIGLSRHRALLFKVLADKIGLPCKLVKGSDYIGIDDGAINMVKLENQREFLVDLMADPGILIPADVLSTKEASLNSSDTAAAQGLASLTVIKSDEVLEKTEGSGNGAFSFKSIGILDGNLTFETVQTQIPMTDFVTRAEVNLRNVGSSSKSNAAKFLPRDSETSKMKAVLEATLDINNFSSEKLNSMQPSPQDDDSRNLFADLNPFQTVGVGKNTVNNKNADHGKVDFHRNTENLALGHARGQQPLVWKNRPACNDIPNSKPFNVLDVPVPKKDKTVRDASLISLQPPARGGIAHSRSPVNSGNSNASGYIRLSSSESLVEECSKQGFLPHTLEDSSTTVTQLLGDRSKKELKQRTDLRGIHDMPKIIHHKPQETEIKVDERHERRKLSHDRHMPAESALNKSEYSISTSMTKPPPRLDPMLDDVAECEIPWEDLVIGERIGLGSYGEVYRAEWNGTEVAVKKFLDQDFYGDALDEFRSEVRIMRRLLHTNIVRFMGAVTRPPNLSIVSEFLPRGSLYRILHRPNCQIDEKRRIKMALDVAEGMKCLHTSSPIIVHRDLKSPNLLVDDNWTVKVCDFGLSRLKHSTFLSSKSTAGTPEWMAPEVLRNEPSNEKCDVYSFGVILWELSTLKMPWSGMNPMQVVGAVGFQDRRLEISKEVDPVVAKIIWQCWQTDPSIRPSFSDLADVLKSLHHLTVPPTLQDTPSRPSQKMLVSSISDL